MARYKQIDTSPRFLAVDLEAQLLHSHLRACDPPLLAHELDPIAFDAPFIDDDTFAPAFKFPVEALAAL
jgi:hypothetical protein